MAFKSTGWNDCPPILDIAPTSAKRSMRRNQSGTHINSLNNGLTNTSSNPSIDQQETGSGKQEQGNETQNANTDDQIMEKLMDVLCIPSRLNTREFAHYSKKLKSGIPGALKAKQTGVDQREFIDNVLTDILEVRDGAGQTRLAECRSLVINYMLVHPGVVGWALPLRKLIESLAFDQLF